MVHLQGPHAGETLATEMLTIIEEFGIQPHLGYFQSDNATSNDTCISTILSRIRVSQPAEAKKQRRLRCLGHIVNLIAKTFLAEASKLEEGENKAGPIKKLHNIVHYIRRSPQRRDAFVKTSEFRRAEGVDETRLASLQLVADNDTRWNSTFMMVARAIRLRSSIELYCAQSLMNEKDGIKDILTAEDWHTLEEVEKILQPFEEITKLFEGNGATLQWCCQRAVFPSQQSGKPYGDATAANAISTTSTTPTTSLTFGGM